MTDPIDVEKCLVQMAQALREYVPRNPLMIGVHTGGAWIAQRLHAMLALPEPLGTLDISFYRDDFTRVGVNPQVKASNLPASIEDRHVLLIDDVLHTGRTIRAALNEIFDYGRPKSVTLAVLIDRNGRELPIEPAVVGARLRLADRQHVKLTGPDPLALTVQESRA